MTSSALPADRAGSKPVGILMLDTRFPRPPGDIGHPATWPFPVRYATVPGADVERAVRRGGKGLLEPFVEAGRRLVEEGAAMLTTSCGFLAPLGPVLAERCGAPVAASSLMQVPWLARTLPAEGRIGILTISKASLTPEILRAAHVPPHTPVGDLEGGTFADSILNDRETLDMEAARTEHVEAARNLVRQHPDVRAIVLECTNMPPHASAIHEATGRPVFSIVTLVSWMRAGFR